VFARNRNFAFLRTAQFLLILVGPALGTAMLGGLDDSSSVILWSLLTPLGAVAFDRPGRAWPWFAAFVFAVMLALVLSEVVRPDGASLPNGFVRTFDVLNIVAVSLVAMMLLVTFARGRDTAQAADVVDFTPLASRLDAREVVGMLDRLFTTLTSSSTATRSRRSRRSATATWSRRGFPGLGPTMRTLLPASRSK
jgi:hypothetical protein